MSKGKHIVMAASEGDVLDIVNHYHNCGGKGVVKAIVIYHKALKKTLVYGGLDSTSIKVKLGELVQKGQELGTVKQCSKLELQLYDGRVMQIQPWKATSKEQTQALSLATNCLTSPILTKLKPTSLEDPTIFLKNIRSLLC